MGLSIRTLGELAVVRDGELLPLPASKKTRGLLAYLALTGRPHRRDRLCEVLWEQPDDPRAALRWSLTKLRPLVNGVGVERLVADRERVVLQTAGIDIDLRVLEARLEEGVDPGLEALTEMARQLDEPLLDGLDLPNQELFQHWLVAEREEKGVLLGRVWQRLAQHPEQQPDRALKWARKWLEAAPYEAAAEALVRELSVPVRRGPSPESRRSVIARHPAAGSPSLNARQLLARQKIEFCTTADDVRIAYACIGGGPTLVKAANWLSHLEFDWDAPIWSPLFRDLARNHRFVRYDERGNGLSDWTVDEITFDAFVKDLETVTDALGLNRFALLGISQGGAVSVEYAVRHPERVSHLVLFGAYPAGWRIGATPAITREREAVIALTETGWGRDDPAYRQIFSSTFMPSATMEELDWFNEFQRRTTSPANAARFLSAFGDIDVRHRLAQVTVPTLVIHSLRDRRIPVATGREIAAAIPNARFLGLESDGHLLLGREAASQVFVDVVREFLASEPTR